MTECFHKSRSHKTGRFMVRDFLRLFIRMRKADNKNEESLHTGYLFVRFYRYTY